MSTTAPVIASPARGPLRGRFFAALAVLLITLVGMHFRVPGLGWLFVDPNALLPKIAVPMRQSFSDAVPRTVGPWVVAVRNEVDKEVELELGTDKFYFFKCINAEALGQRPEDLAATFKSKGYDEQRAEVGRIAAKHPEAVLDVALTYYTGKADTVAHIPERCYIASGYTQREGDTVAMPLPAHPDFQVNYLRFDRAGRLAGSCHVAYVFHSNGKYEADPLAVRFALQDVSIRHAYYAKIELLSVHPDRQKAQEAMKSFLSHGLPQVEKALPDWSQYQNGPR